MGFHVEVYDVTYAWVISADGEVCHLQHQPEVAGHGTMYLHVEDVDAVHGLWKAAGAAVGDVEVQPWGMREFLVRDQAGNRIRVGSPSSE